MDATVSLSRNPSILGAFVAGRLMGGSVLCPQELLGALCTIRKNKLPALSKARTSPSWRGS